MDWSSSSSDEELRTALRHNARNMQAEGRAVPTSGPPITFYNGEAVKVQYGTIYCPFRRKYFHIHPVKRNPADFFGDVNVRRNKRRCLSPSSVQLLDASFFDETPLEFKEITLKEINDNGFYLFNGIRKSSSSSLTTLYPPLLQDFRYSRVALKNLFKEYMLSPVCLRSEKDGWKRTTYQLPPKGIVSSFFDGRFAFCGMGSQSELFIVENQRLLPHSIKIPGGTDDIIGMHCIGRNAMFIVRKNRLQHLSWDSDTPSNTAVWDFSPEVNANFSCSCTNAFSENQSASCVILAHGRSLFTAAMHENTIHKPQKLCTFRTTPILSVDTFSLGPLANQVILCGMRNGTIQAQSLQDIRAHLSFNSGIQLKAACIPYVHCVENSFNFVSVSIIGEIKLWDIRYMNKKEAVFEMVMDTAGGRFHDIQAAFVDDIACFTNFTGCISCINTRRWLSLGQYQRAGGNEGRIHLVRGTFGYQILDAGICNTMAYLLHVVYSYSRFLHTFFLLLLELTFQDVRAFCCQKDISFFITSFSLVFEGLLQDRVQKGSPLLALIQKVLAGCSSKK
ncbi:hypothetical protein TcYC6_0056030 [Trypanosoma cruzi]|nr:hypothetical protein TcYC6_0056030 [Trypanosoma cruzi]